MTTHLLHRYEVRDDEGRTVAHVERDILDMERWIIVGRPETNYATKTQAAAKARIMARLGS